MTNLGFMIDANKQRAYYQYVMLLVRGSLYSIILVDFWCDTPDIGKVPNSSDNR
jgi:hypothetical protein